MDTNEESAKEDKVSAVSTREMVLWSKGSWEIEGYMKRITWHANSVGHVRTIIALLTTTTNIY